MTQTKLGGCTHHNRWRQNWKKSAEIVARHPMVKRIISSVISVKRAAGGKPVANVLEL